jgi:polar amino acid transport system substrate-binding protein
MKGLLALLATSLFFLPCSGLRTAAMPRHPTTDAADVTVFLAAASASASIHEANAPEPQLIANTSAVGDGHSLFNDNCEHCHGPDAVEGIEERNLRHLALRYGNKMDEVFMYTVTHGRPNQGMPNWSGILTQVQFRDILAYLHSIQEH